MFEPQKFYCSKSFKRDICCFDFRSNFLVSISFLINIGKEISLPGFRTSAISIFFLHKQESINILRNYSSDKNSNMTLPLGSAVDANLCRLVNVSTTSCAR